MMLRSSKLDLAMFRETGALLQWKKQDYQFRRGGT